MLANRLEKRFKHLSKWAARTGSGSWRLYDRDIPEIPLVLDVYTEWGPGQERTIISGALYKRPYEKDPADEAAWLEAMKGAVTKALSVEAGHIYLKERRRILDRHEQYGKAEPGLSKPVDEVPLFIEEGGLKFKVKLASYLDTGIFPDRRLLRSRVRSESAGKRLLNLFAYTGTFSVYAAAGGAVSTDSVDLSNTYLAWAEENFRLNGLESGLDTANRLIRADALRFLREARRKWDIIILDPPSFSASKKMTAPGGRPETLDIKRDAPALCKSCLDHLNPGGKLYLSVNARGFHLDEKALPEAQVRDITTTLVDEDFRNRRVPACYEITDTR
jgi:23S rRNA G2069 N7-methylase RlmK/C1962 C5-methylase RlmI